MVSSNLPIGLVVGLLTLSSLKNRAQSMYFWLKLILACWKINSGSEIHDHHKLFFVCLSYVIFKNSRHFLTVKISEFAFQPFNVSPQGDFEAFLGGLPVSYGFVSNPSTFATCLGGEKHLLPLHPILCLMISKEQRSDPSHKVQALQV